MMPGNVGGLVFALIFSSGGFGYWAGDHNRNNAWLAKQSATEHAALVQLQTAQARGDALSNGLLQQQNKIDLLKQESHRAITQTTTGRTCLDAAALRVLDSAPGISVMPTPTGSAVAAGASPGTTGGDSTAWYSTDTQVALWAADTGAAYETCRTRLDALINWHHQESNTP